MYMIAHIQPRFPAELRFWSREVFSISKSGYPVTDRYLKFSDTKKQRKALKVDFRESCFSDQNLINVVFPDFFLIMVINQVF